MQETQAHRPQTRMTQQRAVILEELRNLKTHPTADELYQIVRARMPKISLGTVYRNLLFLSEIGQVICLETAGSTKRFDGNTMPHRHVRCTCCGRISDVCNDTLPQLDLHGMQVEGFSAINACRIEYEGICDECARDGLHLGNNRYQSAYLQ